VPAIASLFVSVGADISNALSGLSSLDSAIDKTAAKMKNAGGDLTAGVTVPIVGAATAIGAIGIGFESAFVKVRKTVDAGKTDLDALETGIINLSKSTDGAGKSAEELAGIAAVAGQLGVDGADDILTLTRVVAQFGLATQIATDQATADLEALRVVTRVPREEFENLSNTIVDLGNQTSASEAQIIENSKRLAGALTAVGVKAPDILAIASAMGEIQLPAEEGGTAVSRVFIEMASAAAGINGPVKDNSKVIREANQHLNDLQSSLQVATTRQQQFGRNTPAAEVQSTAAAIEKYKREISDAQSDLAKLSKEQDGGVGSADAFARTMHMTTDEFKQLVKTDPTKAFTNLVAGLKEIEGAQGTEGVLKALQDLGVTEVRERNTLLQFLSANDKLIKDLEIGKKAWLDNNAAQTEAEKALQSTENQFNLLINQIKGEFIPLWKDTLRPIILQVGQAFKDFIIPAIQQAIHWFQALSPEQQKFALGLLAVAAAAGPVLFIIGAVVAIIGALLTPIGLVVLAIAALAAAWITDFGGIRTTTEGFVKFFMDNWQSIVREIPLIGGPLGAIIDNFDNIKAGASSLMTDLGIAFNFIKDKGGDAIKAFAGLWESTLRPALAQVRTWIADLVFNPLIALLTFIQNVLKNLPGGIGSQFDLSGAIAAAESARGALAGEASSQPAVKTFNAPLVQINNPVVTDQASVDELISRVGSWVTTALVESEKSSDLNLPQQALPGNAF